MTKLIEMLQRMKRFNATRQTQLPDASATVSTREVVAHAKVKGKKSKHEPIVIVLTQAMLAGRMKLPARVFTKGNSVIIDGHKITQQENDQGRSTKFNPEIFGWDLNEGDTLTFEHVEGREWAVDAEATGRKRKAAKPAKPEPKALKASPKRARPVVEDDEDEDEDDDDEDEQPTRRAKGGVKKPTFKAKAPVASKAKASGNGKADTVREKAPVFLFDPVSKASIRKGMKYFADIVVKNYNDDDFKQNENIKATNAMDGGPDARVYLTTAQNQRFKAWRKRMALTLKKSVNLLNDAVEEA